ncbi:hypothetical protein QZH41_007011 [Actinostola sp. cb2023]|nr:hypothetical protein QZH41_007011 [Actinostola sp. cb2023]
MEKIKKSICKIFKENELSITIEANKKVINFLDVTLDLNSGQYRPYMKPNNTLQYVNTDSNHPPTVLKNIPEGINKRLSEISSNETVFNKAAPVYQKALDESGHNYKLHYVQDQPRAVKRNRKRNTIWYNPPYDRNVKTNVGKEFLRIIDKCFPPSNRLHKIFSRNTVKISYSCMPNVARIIDGDNKGSWETTGTPTREKCAAAPKAQCAHLEANA